MAQLNDTVDGWRGSAWEIAHTIPVCPLING